MKLPNIFEREVTPLSVSAGEAIYSEGEKPIAMCVRGTFGIGKDVPDGFKQIRLRIVLDADASPDERARLMELAEFFRFSDTSAAAIPEYLDEGARDPNLDARLNRV